MHDHFGIPERRWQMRKASIRDEPIVTAGGVRRRNPGVLPHIDDDQGSDSSYGPYRPAGFGVQVYGGGSANEYGPYGYPERGYGVYAEPGYRNASSLRGAFDYGRRDGYEAGLDAARYGRYEPYRHRAYQSTRGWSPRFGGRDAYDVNYRNGFRSGYD